MKIIVDRNSVCAGDDVYGHEMTFEVPESLTVAEFFKFVEGHGFLAAIVGNDVAWGLQNRTGKIGEYFTKTGEVTHPEVSIKDKMDEADGDPHFFVRYYSNLEWARENSNGEPAKDSF